MNKRALLPLLIIGALVVGFFLLPVHAKRMLIHNFADIDDYKIFENREVAIGTPQPWMKSERYGKIELAEKHQEGLESFKTVAFSVIHKNQLLYEQYWDGYGPTSHSNSFSAGKSIVSLLIGAAIGDGLIDDVNDPVSKYISEFQDEARKDITIKDVLTMSSGLVWNESYWNPFAVTARAYYGTEVNETALEREVEYRPGKHWDYKSGDTQLLGIIVTRVTGMSLSEYASKKLWQPIGAESPALWSIDKEDGMEKAYCCFNSNARDFARLGQLVLQKGGWNGRQILPRDYVIDAVKPASYLTEYGTDLPADWYGYQFWLMNHKGLKVQAFRGILGQYIFVVPEREAVIVRLGHKRSKTQSQHQIWDDVPVILDAGLSLLD